MVFLLPRRTACAAVLVSLLLVACAPVASPGPTAAPAKPADAAKSTESKPAESKPSEAARPAPAASPAAAAPAVPAASPAAAAAAASPAVAKPSAGGVLEPAIEEAAKKEGTIVLYTSLNEDDARSIVDKFESRYAGVKVDLVRASSEKVVQRLITEIKAGKTLADVVESGGMDLAQVIAQGMVEPWAVPSANSFPADLRDPANMWTAARVGIETLAWNTGKVKADEAPKSFDDAADPKWKGRMMIEAADVEVMLALGERKFGGDEGRVRDYFAKLASNQPQPSTGHTETLALLIAGQGDLFWGAHGHTAEREKGRGAPVDWMRTEAVMTVDGGSLVKNAPHPNAGKLFLHWYLGDEGQKALADVKRVPARPGAADPALLPQKQYVSGPALASKFPTYQKLWNEVLGLR